MNYSSILYIYIYIYYSLNRATGSPRLDTTKLRGKNESRSELRQKVHTITDYVKVSMQCCSLSTNLSLLNEFLEKSTSQKEIDKFKGLIAVFDELTAKSVKNGISCVQSILSMKYALDIYLGYKTDYVAGTKTADDQKSFQENLLHPQYGLRVYVVNLPFTKERFILLRPSDVDLATIFFLFCKLFS